jgi:superfamily I DNA and/or RNA helicase
VVIDTNVRVALPTRLWDCSPWSIYLVGPIVSSDEARKDELDLSLLQRLFERSLYTNEAATTEYFRPYAYLRRNYRSHPTILMPPSALFYNDTLLPCATNGRISWSNLPDQRLPVKIIGCAGDEECIDEVRKTSLRYFDA